MTTAKRGLESDRRAEAAFHPDAISVQETICGLQRSNYHPRRQELFAFLILPFLVSASILFGFGGAVGKCLIDAVFRKRP